MKMATEDTAATGGDRGQLDDHTLASIIEGVTNKLKEAQRGAPGEPSGSSTGDLGKFWSLSLASLHSANLSVTYKGQGVET